MQHAEALMKHIHHIIPKHMGGTDNPENLIELTREEHAAAHLKLYEDYGKKEDLGAFYLLSGQTTEAAQIGSSLGGKAQGLKNARNGHMKRIQKLSDCSAAGKKGGARTIALGKGSFGDPTLRVKSATKGGKTQGKRNAENGHLQRIATLPNPRTSGKRWVTNGTENKMIPKEFPVPDGFYPGKIQKGQ